jgi:hypothetical protein
MTYPGNPSVAPDVRQRIVDTFVHTLGVAATGALEEARLGCDFVLRLDPLFAPAQALADRLANATGPVAVEDLRRRVLGDEELAVASTEWDRSAVAPGLESAPVPRPATDGDSELRAELTALMAQRRFGEAVARAQERVQEVVADPELRLLATEAQERLEADHYVTGFVEKAREALSLGRPGDVPGLLEKVRSLDPEHPDLAELAELAVAAAGVEPPPLDFADEPPQLHFDGEEGLDAAGLDLGALPELAGSLAGMLEQEDDRQGIGEASFAEGLGAAWEPPGGGGSAAAGSPPVGSDSDPRIAELLDEGQAAFERGQ